MTTRTTRSPLTHAVVLYATARPRSRARSCFALRSLTSAPSSPALHTQKISAGASFPATTRRQPLRCAPRARAPREVSAPRFALTRTEPPPPGAPGLGGATGSASAVDAQVVASADQSTSVHVLERPSCSGGCWRKRRHAAATVVTSGAVRSAWSFLRRDERVDDVDEGREEERQDARSSGGILAAARGARADESQRNATPTPADDFPLAVSRAAVIALATRSPRDVRSNPARTPLRPLPSRSSPRPLRGARGRSRRVGARVPRLG